MDGSSPWKARKYFFPCRHCYSCGNSKKSLHIVSFATKKQHRITSFIICNSTNVVYLLTCPCGLQYTGKINRQLRTRINEHRSSICRGDLKSPVARHFKDLNHPARTLVICGIDQILPSRRYSNTDQRLLQCESRWIFQVKTEQPLGLNETLNLSCFL